MEHLYKFLLGLCSYVCDFEPKEVPKGHHCGATRSVAIKRGSSALPTSTMVPPSWVCAAVMWGARPEDWPRLRPRLRLHPRSWNIKCIAIWTGCWKGEILLRFNLPLLAAPIGCRSGPTMDQCRGTSWTKPLPWYLRGICCVAYPSVTCSSVWGKPASCQQVYIPCMYLCAECILCYLHNAVLYYIEIQIFREKCLSGWSVPRLTCMTHREAKMQQPSGGAG